jgi:TolB-like protein/Flp pilus assembly protein TadD
LFFAWAFELTPEGVKRESEVDRSQSITPQTGKKLNNAILLLMAVAIAYLLFDKFSVEGPDPIPTPATGVADNSPSGEPDPALDIEPEKEAAINRQSIAVLPFDNRSNREEDQFFTDGIHDDLLTTIARIGSMKVISRTSVMEYKGTTKKIPEIAKELGVANILEGGIQRSGNQVRINVQLIDAVTDEHLWAQIFDRELTANNLFAIQSEISRAIAEALEATLSPEEQQRIDARPTENILAYDAYLRGRQLMTTRDSEDLTRATEEFGKAVNLDPQFALAWVGVADSHSLLTEYGTLNREEAILIRENAINHALEIDNQLAEAHASLGSLLGSKSRYKEAEEAYKKALELGPNYATAFHWYSNFLKNYPSRANETIALAEKAADLDPRSSVIGTNLASAYANRGLISMAERQLLKVIQQDPTFAIAYSALSGLYAFSMGQFDKALTYALKANELDPGNMRYLGDLFNIYTNVGDLVEPAEVIRKRMGDLDNAHRQTGFADLVINLAQNNSAGVREAINWVLPRISDNTFRPCI